MLCSALARSPNLRKMHAVFQKAACLSSILTSSPDIWITFWNVCKLAIGFFPTSAFPSSSSLAATPAPLAPTPPTSEKALKVLLPTSPKHILLATCPLTKRGTRPRKAPVTSLPTPPTLIRAP
eukprot:CAMPEP_0197523262 /NCGR_PEP_ID=MMETSP1318-20131121/8232_1 /TAXON_ID=552666 /ORGANISM="Partenskyella glossopodia, Strain RCC365" /LENGTH=122 /DNA_ID=CAMNT_0043075897 /DNA_START=464 /DNA_END=832 /DNA_ORIENTATION=-